jgi:hypothetical protein
MELQEKYPYSYMSEAAKFAADARSFILKKSIMDVDKKSKF